MNFLDSAYAPHKAHKVGDLIKAHDFPPMPDRPDMYAVGFITNVDLDMGCYEVDVIKDTLGERGSIYVPFHTMLEYANRIQAV